VKFISHVRGRAWIEEDAEYLDLGKWSVQWKTEIFQLNENGHPTLLEYYAK
jgi:hypothetical protein